jgi:hypothetical protein
MLFQIHVLFHILLYGYVCYFRYMSYFRYFKMDVHVSSDIFDTCGILETFDVVFWRHFIWYFGYILHGYIHYFIDVLFYIDVHIMFMLNVCMFSIFLFLFHRSCVIL